jgi:hypothetical protein
MHKQPCYYTLYIYTRSFPSAIAVGWIKKIYIKKYLGVVNIFLSREKNI